MINKKNIKNLILSGIKKELVLFEDTANIENIETEFSNEYRFFTTEAKEFIENNFLDYNKKNKKLLNEEIISLKSFDFYGGKIFINYESSDIKTYLATKNDNYVKYIESDNFFTIPIVISNITITNDNKIVFLEKENYDLTSDYVKNCDIVSEKIDFLKCFERQIQNVVKKSVEIENSKLIGIYQSDKCVLVFSHNIKIESNYIEEVQNKKDTNNSAKLLFLTNKEDIIGNNIKNENFSNGSRIALKFHLKENFFNYNYINTKI